MQCRKPIKIDSQTQQVMEAKRLCQRLQAELVGSSWHKDWTHFHTATFKKPLSCQSAGRQYCHFLAESGSSLMIKAALWAAEPHPKSPKRSHVHSLLLVTTPNYYKQSVTSVGFIPNRQLSSPNSVNASHLWRNIRNAWFNRCGLNWVRPLNNTSIEAELRYAMKYLLKSSLSSNDATNNLRTSYMPTGKSATRPISFRESEPEWGIWTTGDK